MTQENISNFRCSFLNKDKTYHYFSLPHAYEVLGDLSRLPVSLKVLLENVLRGGNVEDALGFAEWLKTGSSTCEVPFRPARILMQDFTGVPAVVDLAAMRDGILQLGAEPQRVNPQVPVDLVIDHSIQVDVAAQSNALEQNMAFEFSRNRERYAFLRWGQEAFERFRVVPPGAGICHQVNLEYLAQVVFTVAGENGLEAYPDTLFGTDSHTTMINGLGVLGWGVGGIEAEASMLGQPSSMRIPDVVGVCLEGKLPEGTTATDLVLTVTQILRKKGVVGKFVEFYGPALGHLSVADRATIANMAPEYGATVGFFPVDRLTLDYLYQTGRSEEQITLVETYLRVQGLFYDVEAPEPVFTDTLRLDLSTVMPSLAGPRRPQDRVSLGEVASNFSVFLKSSVQSSEEKATPVSGKDYILDHGCVVIAAITSCTSTSNPELLLVAGLLAQKAHALGLVTKPWVKTSLAPGSRVVTNMLDRAGLSDSLDVLGFQTVGYGCTTCIGNSGPLESEITNAIEKNGLVVASVLSGNRNFEGRISPHVRANYLASPPLVVAYALLGTVMQDITTAVFGYCKNGSPIRLADLWPSRTEISALLRSAVDREVYITRYREVLQGTEAWQALPLAKGASIYEWNSQSTYIQKPPYFDGLIPELISLQDICGARILALLGDNVTTDHISPAGAIAIDSPAGRYLQEHGVATEDFNSFGSRRGNDRVMVRGTFSNIRLRNEMVPGTEGGVTCLYPGGEQTSIFEAAMQYREKGVPLVVIGGKEYGMGSSRDWAAKGTALLGVKAVVAESFERIHRANLVGMGVLPLTFPLGVNRKTLGLTGSEVLDIQGIDTLSLCGSVTLVITSEDGAVRNVSLRCCINTLQELVWLRNGGLLPCVLKSMAI